VWFDFGLSRISDPEQLIPDPHSSGSLKSHLDETRHKEDYGFCDSMAYDGGRYIYAGTVAGVLCRIDIEEDTVEKIAHVIPAGRFPAMNFGPCGKLYGAGGMKGQTALFRFDTESLQFKLWDRIIDPETGEKPARIHDLCVDKMGVIYLAENDNHLRSSYLWSVEVPDS
jgi:sugar lactone lactonase YvrE